VHYVFNPNHYIGIVIANTTLLYKYFTILVNLKSGLIKGMAFSWKGVEVSEKGGGPYKGEITVSLCLGHSLIKKLVCSNVQIVKWILSILALTWLIRHYTLYTTVASDLRSTYYKRMYNKYLRFRTRKAFRLIHKSTNIR